MSDQLMITLQAALQQLAAQHTAETLGDRATYLGASDIGACPRKTILTKLKPPEANLVTRLYRGERRYFGGQLRQTGNATVQWVLTPDHDL